MGDPDLKTIKLMLPTPLLEAIQAKAAEEDENVSSLIRRVVAQYCGWNGQTRIIRKDGNG
jgi:hypothetical protein